MVMDRLFLWIFTVAVLVGTAGIILQVMMTMMLILVVVSFMMQVTTDDEFHHQAPTLYDDRDPIDYRLSEIGLATSRPMAGAYQERPGVVPDQVQY